MGVAGLPVRLRKSMPGRFDSDYLHLRLLEGASRRVLRNAHPCRERRCAMWRIARRLV